MWKMRFQDGDDFALPPDIELSVEMQNGFGDKRAT